jgi:hypothetical protein
VGPLADKGAVWRRKITGLTGKCIPNILSSARSLGTVVTELPVSNREPVKLLIF